MCINPCWSSRPWTARAVYRLPGRIGTASTGNTDATNLTNSGCAPLQNWAAVDLFDHDGQIGCQGSDGAYCSPHWYKQCADHADGQRQFDQYLVFFIFDDDAADVAFVDDLFDFPDQLFAIHAKFFVFNFFFCHCLFSYMIWRLAESNAWILIC